MIIHTWYIPLYLVCTSKTYAHRTPLTSTAVRLCCPRQWRMCSSDDIKPVNTRDRSIKCRYCLLSRQCNDMPSWMRYIHTSQELSSNPNALTERKWMGQRNEKKRKKEFYQKKQTKKWCRPPPETGDVTKTTKQYEHNNIQQWAPAVEKCQFGVLLFWVPSPATFREWQFLCFSAQLRSFSAFLVS